MFSPYALFIGTRYTASRRGSRLSAFLSRTAIAGLAIGVGLLITVLSVMNGFEREMRVRILGLVPHVSLFPGPAAPDWQQAAPLIAEEPGVAGVAPLLQLNAMVVKGAEVATTLLFGIDPEREAATTVLSQYVDAGALARLQGEEPAVVLGSGVADKLGLARGDRVTVVVPQAGGARMATRIERATVVGILSSGTELDQRLALVELPMAQRLGDVSDNRVALRVMVDDLFEAPAIGNRLWTRWQSSYGVGDWTRSQGNLYSAIELSKRLVGMMLAIIIAVAVFNVVSALVLVVNDKQGDIAILRTQGAGRGGIVCVFLVQGFLVGAIGTALGVVLGVLLSLAVTDLVALLERLLQIQFLKSDVYPVSYLPADLRWSDVGRVAATALGVSALGALYPAWRAARVEPAAALRHD